MERTENYSFIDEPNLEKGDIIDVEFKPKEKETSPPKHYTIETLNNYLKNPFREDKANADAEDDAQEYKAIFEGLELGTEATRTGIIDNAVKSKYIELKKDVYKILPDGEYLIEQLINMGISMDKYKTSELGQALKKVYHGDITIDESVSQAVNEIKGVFGAPENSPESDKYFGFAGDEIGVCPVCGSTVTRGKYGYQCRGYKEGCRFSIPGILCKRVITPDNAKKLLEGKGIECFIANSVDFAMLFE